MAIFGIKTKKDKLVSEFISETEKRFKTKDFFKNPFHSKILKINRDFDTLYIIEMNVVYPNFSYLGWVVAGGIFLIFGLKWYIIFPVFLGLAGLFWSSSFYYLMLKLGLKKKGFKGKIKFLNKNEILKEVIFYGKE